MLISAARIEVIIWAGVGIGSNSVDVPNRSLSIVKDAEFLLRHVSAERKLCCRNVFLLQKYSPALWEKVRPCGVLTDSLRFRFKNIFSHCLPSDSFSFEQVFSMLFSSPVQKPKAKVFLTQTEKSFLHKKAFIRKICLWFLCKGWLNTHNFFHIFPQIVNVTVSSWCGTLKIVASL